MFVEHFKLRLQPFGVTPDTKFLYLSETHREALASLLYGIQCGRGFSALVAAPGMGKTTLLFRLLALMEGNASTAFLFRTLCTPEEFLRALLADLGIEHEGSDIGRMHAKLNAYLLEESRKGRQVIVVVDEAQNLDESVLEMVRILSNFETPGKKLMHIVLSGQPQLAEKLASERLTQLRQRISVVARLVPFTAAETREYMEHRLRMAGGAPDKPVFSEKAYAMIAEHSAGIPRNINNLCFNTMSLACALQRNKVDALMVQEAINDLDLKAIVARKSPKETHRPRLFAFVTTAKVCLRYGLAVAAGILIALAVVSVHSLSHANDHISPQNSIIANHQGIGGESDAASVANVLTPHDPRAQNPQDKAPRDISPAIWAVQIPRTKTSSRKRATQVVNSPHESSNGRMGNPGTQNPGIVQSPQELPLSKYPQVMELTAPARSDKAQAAPEEERVPVEPTPQRGKP